MSISSFMKNYRLEFFFFLREVPAAESIKVDPNDFYGKNLVLNFLGQKGPNWAQIDLKISLIFLEIVPVACKLKINLNGVFRNILF